MPVDNLVEDDLDLVVLDLVIDVPLHGVGLSRGRGPIHDDVAVFALHEFVTELAAALFEYRGLAGVGPEHALELVVPVRALKVRTRQDFEAGFPVDLGQHLHTRQPLHLVVYHLVFFARWERPHSRGHLYENRLLRRHLSLWLL